MQGIPENLLLDGYPPFLLQETDTATPRTPIPVYYIHTPTHPFCGNTLCACHRNIQDMTRLLGGIVEGTFLLHDAASLMQTGEEAMSDSTCTTPTPIALKICPHFVNCTATHGKKPNTPT
jgi:hypothetical protein